MKDKVLLCLCGQLSVIINLRNPTLKPRHWEEIEAVLETQFTPEEPLTLGRLIDIDAFFYADQLEEISGKASSEAGLESILKKVCSFKCELNLCLLVYSVIYPVMLYAGLISADLSRLDAFNQRVCHVLGVSTS